MRDSSATEHSTIIPHPVAVTGIATAVAVAAARAYSLALLSDGTIMAWGSGPLGNAASEFSAVPMAVTA
jgi:hypothetical protein